MTASYTVSSFVIFTVYRKLLTEQIKTDEIAKPVAGTRDTRKWYKEFGGKFSNEEIIWKLEKYMGE